MEYAKMQNNARNTAQQIYAQFKANHVYVEKYKTNEGGRWVTVNKGGEDGKGNPIFIKGDGTVRKPDPSRRSTTAPPRKRNRSDKDQIRMDGSRNSVAGKNQGRLSQKPALKKPRPQAADMSFDFGSDYEQKKQEAKNKYWKPKSTLDKDIAETIGSDNREDIQGVKQALDTVYEMEKARVKGHNDRYRMVANLIGAAKARGFTAAGKNLDLGESRTGEMATDAVMRNLPAGFLTAGMEERELSELLSEGTIKPKLKSQLVGEAAEYWERSKTNNIPAPKKIDREPVGAFGDDAFTLGKSATVDRYSFKESEHPRDSDGKFTVTQSRPERRNDSFDDQFDFKTDGGRMGVAKSKWAPTDWSVTDTLTDEDKRGKGIASALIQKAKDNLDGTIGAQTSSDASTRLFWKHGFRLPGGGSLEDAYAKRAEDSSVNLIYDPSQQEAPQQPKKDAQNSLFGKGKFIPKKYDDKDAAELGVDISHQKESQSSLFETGKEPRPMKPKKNTAGNLPGQQSLFAAYYENLIERAKYGLDNSDWTIDRFARQLGLFGDASKDTGATKSQPRLFDTFTGQATTKTTTKRAASRESKPSTPQKKKDGGWITIHGTHVFIDKKGQISKGPDHFVGKKPSEINKDTKYKLPAKKEEPKKPEPAKQKKPQHIDQFNQEGQDVLYTGDPKRGEQKAKVFGDPNNKTWTGSTSESGEKVMAIKVQTPDGRVHMASGGQLKPAEKDASPINRDVESLVKHNMKEPGGGATLRGVTPEQVNGLLGGNATVIDAGKEFRDNVEKLKKQYGVKDGVIEDAVANHEKTGSQGYEHNEFRQFTNEAWKPVLDKINNENGNVIAHGLDEVAKQFPIDPHDIKGLKYRDYHDGESKYLLSDTIEPPMGKKAVGEAGKAEEPITLHNGNKSLTGPDVGSKAKTPAFDDVRDGLKHLSEANSRGDKEAAQAISKRIDELKSGNKSGQPDLKSDGPKDGDRNADGLVFKNGRWRRDGEEKQPIEAKFNEAKEAAKEKLKGGKDGSFFVHDEDKLKARQERGLRYVDDGTQHGKYRDKDGNLFTGRQGGGGTHYEPVKAEEKKAAPESSGQQFEAPEKGYKQLKNPDKFIQDYQAGKGKGNSIEEALHNKGFDPDNAKHFNDEGEWTGPKAEKKRTVSDHRDETRAVGQWMDSYRSASGQKEKDREIQTVKDSLKRLEANPAPPRSTAQDKYNRESMIKSAKDMIRQHDDAAAIKPTSFSSEHDASLKEAEPFTQYGKDYDRNVATAAARMKSAAERGHSPQMLDHLHKELKGRLELKKELEAKAAAKKPIEQVYNKAKGAAKQKQGPKDGDKNAKGLVFRDGRWRREDSEAKTEKPKKLTKDEKLNRRMFGPREGDPKDETKSLEDLRAERKEVSDKHIWNNAMSKGSTRPSPPDTSELNKKIKDAEASEGKADWQRDPESVKSVKGMPIEKHKELVEKALAEGRDVPKSVLEKHGLDDKKPLPVTPQDVNAIHELRSDDKRPTRKTRDAAIDAVNAVRSKIGNEASELLGKGGIAMNQARMQPHQAATHYVHQIGKAKTNEEVKRLAKKALDEMSGSWDRLHEELGESAKGEKKTDSVAKPISKKMHQELVDKAHGHEDNASTQAARRLLKRFNIDWKDRKPDAGAKAEPPKDTSKDHRGNEYAPGVTPDIIPRSTAYNAHAGTSHSPERRAETRQKEFAAAMNSDYQELKAAAKGDENKLKTLDGQWPRYLDRAKSNYIAALNADSRTMSPMITGPARFPVSSNNKKMDTASKRWDEFHEGLKKGMKSIKKQMSPEDAPIKIGDKGVGSVLDNKIEAMQKHQDHMKEANAIIRRHVDFKKTSHYSGDVYFKDGKSADGLVKELQEKTGISETDAKKLARRDPYSNSVGYPKFQLTNNNANIRRTKDQVREQQRHEAEAAKVAEENDGDSLKSHSFDGGNVELDYDDNRLRIVHDQKPSKEVIQSLKSRGFRWSPKNGAWQRQLTRQAKYDAESLVGVNFDDVEKSSVLASGSRIERFYNDRLNQFKQNARITA